VSWTDSSGNLWLFGGQESDNGFLNDLWEFNPAAKTWTWVSGNNTANASGFYGTLGVPSASNAPGAREGSVSWTDSSGNLWLFGGVGCDSSCFAEALNDLWEFNPTAKTWTWVSGNNTPNASGVYGTMGVASSGNMPGARYGSVSWADSSGNLWLFGGAGYDSRYDEWGELNDLWEFDPTAKTWKWISGSNTAGASGVYGAIGVASTSNMPEGRYGSVSWTDSSGNLWLFGGGNAVLALNDLWRYQP
jgi:N-acetylneuraminic acid mutarotase